MWNWLIASGHPDAEAGHPDVAEEGQEVDEQVKGEVDGGHVQVEGQAGQGRLLLLLQVRRSTLLHGIQLSCHPGWCRCGVEWKLRVDIMVGAVEWTSNATNSRTITAQIWLTFLEVSLIAIDCNETMSATAFHQSFTT